MARRVSEAAKGTGEAKAAIKELGLNARELNKLAPDVIFSRLADAFEKLNNSGDKLRLGMKLFDTEGVGLIVTMKGGSKALQAVQKDAELLGLTFSRLDGAKVQNLNVAISRLGGLLRGAVRTLSIELSPFIGALTDKLVAIGTAGGGATETIIRGFETALKLTAKIATIWDEIALLGKKAALKGAGVLGLLGKARLGVQTTAMSLGIDLGLSPTNALGQRALKKEIEALELSLAGGSRQQRMLDFIKGIRDSADKAAGKAGGGANPFAIMMSEGGRFFRRLRLGGAGLRDSLLAGTGGGARAALAGAGQTGSLTQLTRGFGVVSGVERTNAILREVGRDVKEAIEFLRVISKNAVNLRFLD